MRKTLVVIGLLSSFALVLAGWAASYLARDHAAVFAARGMLEDVVTAHTRRHGTRTVIYATLTTNAGIRVPVAVSLPAEAPVLPNVVMAGGYRTGRDAVMLIPDALPAAFAAIDYPYDGDLRDDRRALLVRLPGYRRAGLDTPPSLLATAEYVRRLSDTDPERTLLMGVSFGGPFALAALAAEPDIGGLVYAYAGGDIASWSAHSFRDRPAWFRLSAAGLLAFTLAPLEPARHAPRLGERPLLIVSGTEDETVNPESLEPMFAAVDGPYRHVRLDGPHIGAGRAGIIEDFLGVALDWLETVPVGERDPVD